MRSTAAALPATGGTGSASVRELDIFRGWAAILMIINHAGYRLLSPVDSGSGLAGLAVFLGSFAPVLFFFATGFGIGLRPPGQPPPRLLETSWKAALLVAADQAMYWRTGASFGLDFFSFIGIASLLIAVVARSERPVRLSLWLVVAILAARYLLGPLARPWLPEDRVTDWLIGRGQPGVSYPFAPWMVYPLLAFVLGRRYGAGRSDLQLRRWLGAGAIVFVAALTLTAAMLWMNAHLLRWGSMSASFFVLSLGVLSAFAMLSAAGAKAGLAGRLLELRGVASFAIIPLHYALLDLCSGLDLPLPTWGYAALTLAIIAVSWIGAGALASAVQSGWLAERRRVVLPTLVFLLAALLMVVAAGPHGPSPWMTAAVFGAQLSIAALLGLRAGTKADARAKLGAARV